MDNNKKVCDMVDAKVFVEPEPKAVSSKTAQPGSIGNNELNYNINEKSPGVVLIFNHGEYRNSKYNRHYWEEDKRNMKKVWKERNFEVYSSDNLTSSEIKSRIEKVSKKDYGKDTCFVCVLHTHGTGGQLLAHDGWYPTAALYEPFLVDESKWHGKPKLFLLQACLGTEAEDKVTVTDSTCHLPAPCLNFDNVEVIPRYNELLLVRSTTYGYVSFRCKTGSWFLKTLCDKMTEFGQMDFESMLTLVKYTVARNFESYNTQNCELNEKKQTITVLSTLTKKLFLKKCITADNHSHHDAVINHQKRKTSFINNSDRTQKFRISASISESIANNQTVSFNFELG